MLGHTVTRHVRALRRQLIRATKAKEIAGPNLKPEFIRHIKQQLKELNDGAALYITQFNSGVLDSAAERDLTELRERLLHLVATLDWIVKAARKLKVGSFTGYAQVVKETESIRDRFLSIRDGVSLALEVDFRLTIQDAVEKCVTNSAHMSRCIVDSNASPTVAGATQTLSQESIAT